MDKCKILNLYYSHTFSDALFINCGIVRLKLYILKSLINMKHNELFFVDIPISLLKILVKPSALKQHEMLIQLA